MKNKITLISDSVTYDFIYIGTIKPKCDEKNNCILTKINNTDYCNFSVSFPEKEGIYLWVLDNQIEYSDIYLKESDNCHLMKDDNYMNYIMPLMRSFI